jgi:dihydroorotase
MCLQPSILAASARAALLSVLATVLLASSALAQESYDVVLVGGRVMDPETGLDAIRNVGIRGQTVVAISEDALTGDVVIDAEGLVVAPGFIDLHAHGQTNRANDFQAMDGVTTALELEGGMPDIASYLRSRSGNSVLNFGASMSHGSARMWSMPQYAEEVAEASRLLEELASREPTLPDLMALDALLEVSRYDALPKERYGALRTRLNQGMAEGALGIGMPHQYYPGANHDEIYRVFEMAGDGQIPIYTHVRAMAISAMQEVIANATATRAPLHIVHLNSMSLWDIETNLDLISGAQAAGVDVTTEAYPYTAASTSLQSAIFDEGWQERLRISYGDLQWQETGERLTEKTFAEYREQGGIVIIHLMQPEWISSAMAAPNVMVASDGMPYAPGAHPRSAGTFARFLGRYVRDESVMSLMEGLSKVTLMPAQRLEAVSPQMHRKGRIQIGSDADITVFDPARIIDTATFDGDLSYSEGVEFVLVNGEFVVREGAIVEGARPGRAVVGRLVVF